MLALLPRSGHSPGMQAVIVNRHSPQDAALSMARREGRIVRAQEGAATEYFMVKARSWSPASREARYELERFAR